MKRSSTLLAVSVLALAGCSNDFMPGFGMSDNASPFPTEKTEQAENADHHAYQRAVAYHHGFGVPKNHGLAEQYYLEAIEKDQDTRAMNELGVLLLDPATSLYDPHEAYRNIAKAAERGNSTARYNLGVAYYYGFGGVLQNKGRGFDFISTAAHQGEPKAQAFIVDWITFEAEEDASRNALLKEKVMELSESGDLSYWDISTLDTDYRDLWTRFFEMDLEDRSTMLFDILAVESGCRECTSGNRFEVGRKLTEIENWRSQLGSQEDPTARFNLGLAYLKGDGVPSNLEKGATYIIRSADAGFAPAQFLLGKLFMEGRGIQQNRAMAYAWFNIAASDTWGYRETEWAMAMRDWSTAHMTAKEVEFGQKWATHWTKNSQWYLKDLK